MGLGEKERINYTKLFWVGGCLIKIERAHPGTYVGVLHTEPSLFPIYSEFVIVCDYIEYSKIYISYREVENWPIILTGVR